MKGLLLRLSAVDSDAEAAVRVIAYFDELVAHRATVADLVRATASLAECVAGLRRGAEPALRFRPDGTRALGAEVRAVASDPGAARAEHDGEHPATARLVATDLGGEADGRVWLERDGGPGPLDDLVLERFAIAARVLGPAPQAPPPHLADPALVELVLGERAAAEDRSRALLLLGLDAARPLRVVAVGTEDGRDPGAAAVALVARGGTALGARVAVVGDVAAVLLQPREGPATVVGSLENALSSRARERGSSGTVRVGVGDAVTGLDARRSWLQARLAERFAVPATEPLVVHEDLGSLTLLAEIPADHLRAQPDVRALDSLAAPDLETLEAFCRTGSLRQAAVALHRHHSSVATRLAHVEDALGWPLDDPAGRFRARLALLAHRLARRT